MYIKKTNLRGTVKMIRRLHGEILKPLATLRYPRWTWKANGPFAVGSKKSPRIDGDRFDDRLSRDFRRFLLVAAEEPTPEGLKSFSRSLVEAASQRGSP